MAEENKKGLNHEMFTNKDGYVEGGKEIEMTNPSETQEAEVQGQGNILAEKKEKLSGTNMAWFSLAKIAMQAGAKIYSNRQKTKMAMSDAQLMHAEKMARGEEAYQGKLLEARQSDWKDEFVLIILSAPIIVLAWAVVRTIQKRWRRSNYFLSISLHYRHGLQTCGSLSWRVFLV